MTREEIIQGLQFTIDMFLFDPLTGEPITKPRNDMDKTTIDACKGAIELLQQQPYNTSEWCHDCSEYNHEKHCCPRLNKVIRNTVEEIKKPKTGHWIEVEKYSDGKHKIKCSECRSHIIDRGHANSYVVKEKYKYCPRCGARMIEPQESEDKE